MAKNEPIDDKSIPDTDRLFRRVPPNQLYSNEDGSQRPTSSVFKTSELSVNIESLMIEQGRPPQDCLTNYPNEYLTSITASDVRSCGCPIVKDILPPNDPAHGLVFVKKKDSFANKMMRNYKWVIEPPKKLP